MTASDCRANSLVGTRITAYTPSVRLILLSLDRKLCINGTAYDNVFPEPENDEKLD